MSTTGWAHQIAIANGPSAHTFQVPLPFPRGGGYIARFA